MSRIYSNLPQPFIFCTGIVIYVWFHQRPPLIITPDDLILDIDNLIILMKKYRFWWVLEVFLSTNFECYNFALPWIFHELNFKEHPLKDSFYDNDCLQIHIRSLSLYFSLLD